MRDRTWAVMRRGVGSGMMCRGSPRTSSAGCSASRTSACSGSGRSCVSTNSPLGRRLMMPLSMPSSASDASRRWADRHSRRVTTNPMIGAAKKPTRKIQVVASSGMPNVADRTSLPCGRPQVPVPGDGGDAEGRTRGGVAGAVAHVVRPGVADDPSFEEGVQGDQGQEHHRQHDGRQEDVPADRVAA